ncbi:UNVERIFIED_CONTAM: hypothetical protein Sradi_3369200 [Sesamum radiatum]|uniref:Uncharacterized protein n=1 Tax=Sesamum radiatum TaxID=300843 RepID=A0AAW2R2T8_SESRA
MFPSTTVTQEAVTCSHHSALWIDLDGERSSAQARRNRRFQFEDAWTTSPECADVIRQAWCSVNGTNSRQVLFDKIRASRTHLTQWNKSGFSNIRRRSQEINAEICRMQEQTITSAGKIEIERLKYSLEQLAVQEEILWKQRAKALWLEAGDRNTSFFHAEANERLVRKEIKRIKNESGEEVTSMQAFGGLF